MIGGVLLYSLPITIVSITFQEFFNEQLEARQKVSMHLCEHPGVRTASDREHRIAHARSSSTDELSDMMTWHQTTGTNCFGQEREKWIKAAGVLVHCLLYNPM